MNGRKELSQHILTTSAQLVGICLTVISLVKALHIGHVGSILDKLLAVNSLFFTISVVLSYLSMREEKLSVLERYADYFFMAGLIELGCCAILLSLEII